MKALKFWKTRPRYYETSVLPVWGAAGGDESPIDSGGKYAGVVGRLSSSVTAKTIYLVCSTALNVIAVPAVVILALQQPRPEVVAVVFDDYGRVRDTVVADGMTLNENRAAFFVGMYINNVRSITLDRLDMRKDWDLVLAISTPQAKASLARKEEEDEIGDPFKADQSITREVIDIYVTPETFDQTTGVGTFTVTWGEIIWRNGQPAEPRRYYGTVNTTEVAPANKDAVMRNPVGLWVTSISWQEAKPR